MGRGRSRTRSRSREEYRNGYSRRERSRDSRDRRHRSRDRSPAARYGRQDRHHNRDDRYPRYERSRSRDRRRRDRDDIRHYNRPYHHHRSSRERRRSRDSHRRRRSSSDRDSTRGRPARRRDRGNDTSSHVSSKRRRRHRKESSISERSSRSRRQTPMRPINGEQPYPEDGPLSDNENHLIYGSGDCIMNRFVIKQTVGEGTFGKVVLCTDGKYPGRNVAVKVVKRVRKYYKSAKLEINVLRELAQYDPEGHHRCVRMFEHFDFHGFMCLAFEPLGKSVFDFLKDNMYFPYPMKHVRRISYQLIDSVAFLHRHRVTHTDLKPENILFVNSDYEVIYNKRFKRDERHVIDPAIKLIDFGSATFDDEQHTTVVSTRHYRAIEVILEIGWNNKCDVWSVGAIMFELYTGTTLFQTHNNLEHLAMMTYIFGTIPYSLIKCTQKNYFKRDRLNWDFDEESGGNVRISAQCRPFEECIIQQSDKDHQNLFKLMRKLLEYEPQIRLEMQLALNSPYFDSCREEYRVRSPPRQNSHNNGCYFS